MSKTPIGLILLIIFILGFLSLWDSTPEERRVRAGNINGWGRAISNQAIAYRYAATGIYINDDHVVTASSQIVNCPTMMLWNNGAYIERIRIVATDPIHNLAVIQTAPRKAPTYATLASTIAAPDTTLSFLLPSYSIGIFSARDASIIEQPLKQSRVNYNFANHNAIWFTGILDASYQLGSPLYSAQNFLIGIVNQLAFSQRTAHNNAADMLAVTELLQKHAVPYVVAEIDAAPPHTIEQATVAILCSQTHRAKLVNTQ